MVTRKSFYSKKKKKKKNLTDIVLSKLYGLSYVLMQSFFRTFCITGKKMHALDTTLEVKATLRGLESSTVIIISSDAILS